LLGHKLVHAVNTWAEAVASGFPSAVFLVFLFQEGFITKLCEAVLLGRGRQGLLLLLLLVRSLSWERLAKRQTLR